MIIKKFCLYFLLFISLLLIILKKNVLCKENMKGVVK